MSDSKRVNECPGCKGKSETDELLAFGMVVSAAEAMMTNKLDDIEFAANHMTPFEAHKAVTLLCVALRMLETASDGVFVALDYLGAMREGLNEKLGTAA